MSAGGAGMVPVTAADWDARVLGGDVPVLVDFWATWCVPCMRLEPVLGEIAERYTGRLTVASLDVDDQPAVAGRYDVLHLPTLVLFHGGAPVARLTGAVTPKKIAAALASHLDDPD